MAQIPAASCGFLPSAPAYVDLRKSQYLNWQKLCCFWRAAATVLCVNGSRKRIHRPLLKSNSALRSSNTCRLEVGDTAGWETCATSARTLHARDLFCEAVFKSVDRYVRAEDATPLGLK